MYLLSLQIAKHERILSFSISEFLFVRTSFSLSRPDVLLGGVRLTVTLWKWNLVYVIKVQFAQGEPTT
jgi:hypothetical protein